MADGLIPTQVTQQQVGFAPEIAPYATKLLGEAYGLSNIETNPFQQYMGDRFAQFTPLQQQAFAGAQSMQAAPQLADASALAGTAGLQALQATGYNPMYYTPQSFTDQGVAQNYMNPYMGAMQQQLQRSADIQRQQIGAQAAQAGAYGGARSGLMNQQLNAELMRQQQQQQAQAFGQAQQQFNQEQAQRQAAAQLTEQSRQYGAGLGLQGLQTALQGASQLGQLGGTQFGQNMAINQLQQQYGQQQQQQTQNILNQQYQDFLNYQNYPYKQLGFFSDILRGMPLTQTGANVYAQPPSTLGTLAGLGLGMYGLTKKEGGAIKGYAEGGMAYGGDVTSDNFVEGAIKRLSNSQLQQALNDALNRRDVRQAEMIQEELRERAEAASYSRGLAGAAPTNMQDMLPSEESMRRGGIIAFAEPDEANNYSLVEEPASPAGRFISDFKQKMEQQEEDRNLRRQVRNIYAPAASAQGFFMNQSDVERQRAKDIMANLDTYSKDELRALASGDKNVRYPIAGQGRGRGTVGMTAEDAASLYKTPAKGISAAAPATTKKADSAAKAVGTAVAQTAGTSTEDEIAKAQKYMNFFASHDQPLFDAMKEQIDDIKAKSKELGENKTKQALSAFGFKMAQAASQIGTGAGLAGALRAAGAAAPEITTSIQDTEKMQREYDRLGKQMNVAMLQAQVSAARGDKHTALGLIKANEQIDLQRRQLEEQIRTNKANEAIRQNRAAAGDVALQRAIQQSRTAIARDALDKSLKEWNDPYKGMALKKQYPTREAYEKALFESAWSRAMPQLQYMGTLNAQSDGG